MTVYVVNPPSRPDFDLTPALQFGDIKYINARYVYGDEITDALPADVQSSLITAAVGFNVERDYVLIAGDYLQLCMFMAELGRQWRPHPIRVLRWDKKAAGYIPVWV